MGGSVLGWPNRSPQEDLMKISEINGSVMRGWILPALALASMLPSTIAAAQSTDTQDTGIDYPRQRPVPNATGTAQTGSQAAATQVQANGDTRYTPEQIESAPTRQRNRTANQGEDETGGASRNDQGRQGVMPTQRPAPPNEFESYVSDIADKPLRRFGAALLTPSSRDFIASPTTAVPPDYLLNPGDEIVLGLTGSVNAENLKLRVDSDGNIFVPKVGNVAVAGVRYGDLESVISARVSRQYRNFRLSVTIGELHGLTVYVTGFAQTPGSYTVTSLSTLVNAVMAAGGPAVGGSFRSIQLRRNGKLISDFDLYDFLLKGDKSGDAALQNGDVIYIAPVGAQVAVIGSVNNESIFEAKPKDTLTDILIYAGGVNTVADDTRLLVLDPLSTTAGWQQLTPADAGQTIARRAVVLRVLSGVGIARPLSQQSVLITINGEVQKPGRYYVPAGTSTEAVITMAGGLTEEAYAYGAVFTRDTLRLQQRKAYERALRDAEYLLTVAPLTSAANTGGDQVARLQALRSTIGQLEQLRPDGRLVLGVEPDAKTIPANIVLENNDAIYVPPRPVTVGVFGSVASPATFTIKPSQTIGDYVKMAGGVQKIGDRGGIFVVRANGTLLAPRRGLFSGSVLTQPALPGDLIFVPINASRNEFWARLKDLTQVLFTGAVTAAAVAAIP